MFTDWLGYSETIDTFTFREKASLSIPKRVRKRAFSLQVDVEIVSTNGNDYTNDKSSPEYGFYGYVVMVFRDHAQIQIPIAQPRQMLYYGRVNEAYVNWFQFYLWRNARSSSYDQADVLGQIGQAVGLGNYVIPPRECIKWSGFEELPLRELYIKSRLGTQFKIEVSRWEANYEQSTDGCPSVPESNQEDDTKPDGTGKDDGLPPLGVQPQKSGSLNDPYGGFPPISTNIELGEYGNNKINGIDFPNPNNAPTPPPPETFWVRAQTAARFSYLGCNKIRNEDYSYSLSAFDETVRLVPANSSPTGCNGLTGRDYDLFSNLTNQKIGSSGVTDTESVTLSYGTGIKPESRLYVT